MARAIRIPVPLILCLFLCPFLICALALPRGNRQVQLAQMSLSTGQDDHYEELDGLSHPPVDIITAPQREHVIIVLSDRDKAERTNAYLRYMESYRGQPAQEALLRLLLDRSVMKL
jgi:hypothetical protein